MNGDDLPMADDKLQRVALLLPEWKRLEDAFHDNLPSQGECGDPSHGKALCQFLYDNSEEIRAAIEALSAHEGCAVTEDAIIAAVMAHVSVGGRNADDAPAIRLDVTSAKDAVRCAMRSATTSTSPMADPDTLRLREVVREVAERLSIEAQLVGQSIGAENGLRAKMGDCAKTLFAALTQGKRGDSLSG